MQGPHLRKYGVATTVNFDLFEVDGVNFRINAVHAASDIQISKDEGVQANTGSGFVDEGDFYSVALTATEMQAARIVLRVEDQTATKIWLDKSISIETYGNASAQHAFDLDNAFVATDIVSAGAITTSSGAVGTVTTVTNQVTAAQINAEVVNVIDTDTSGEPAQGAPGVTLSLRAKIDWLFKAFRNKKEQSLTEWRLFNDAGTVVDSKATVSDAAGTSTKEEIVTGP